MILSARADAFARLTHHLEVALFGVEVVEGDGGLEDDTGGHVSRVRVGTGDGGESVA